MVGGATVTDRLEKITDFGIRWQYVREAVERFESPQWIGALDAYKEALETLRGAEELEWAHDEEPVLIDGEIYFPVPGEFIVSTCQRRAERIGEGLFREVQKGTAPAWLLDDLRKLIEGRSVRRPWETYTVGVAIDLFCNAHKTFPTRDELKKSLAGRIGNPRKLNAHLDALDIPREWLPEAYYR